MEIIEKLLDIYRERERERPSEYARAPTKSVWFFIDGNRKTKKRKKKQRGAVLKKRQKERNFLGEYLVLYGKEQQ